ncbi:eCIS core domain-containing protein [Aquimarina algiphila]|uniref:eCIS core domain-containing protein n=1 Tax=Aquimarina algiphila TaxID=2047982 RepID=UPI00232DF85D|nr:DUF4157 domain-containing protein [Aquimarina algiphila]
MKKIRPRKPNKNKKEESDAFFSNAENKAKESSGSDSFFQAKLEIGDPSSPFEKEADAMADHVLQQNNEKVPGDAFGKQSVQRQAEEEEPAAKRIQRQAEEEEPAAKRIQRQAEEEEPAAKRIQRQAEEEEPAAKRIQRQAEEEEPAAKRIQRQAEEEEPAAKQIQLQAEEEEPAAKRIQRQTEEEEPATKQIQRKTDDEATQAKGESKEKKGKKTEANAMESVEAMIQETKGQGIPLPEEIKAELEAEMKADFTNVRIHTDEKAIELSAMLNAQAFTHGYDIYFNMGKYDPYSRSGKHLLVHELTHVVQQKG